jgi:methylenetetrahydrofolate reductase (NADPH)
MPDYSELPARHDGTDAATSVVSMLNANRPTLSFEFFPPKDAEGAESLWRNFDKLLEVSPDFASVTYGAGGSNRATSLAVVERMSKQLPTIGHLTCVGASAQSTSEIIRRFEAAGVSSILALRGDPPKDSVGLTSEVTSALQLIDLIRTFSQIEIGVAAFPEKHPESVDFAQDAKVLKLKQDAGATFAMTQLFFTVEAYTSLVERNRAAGVTMPIVPGVMPISNAAKVLRMAEMSGAAVPSQLLAKLQNANEDEARVIGMDYTIEFANNLIAAGAPGLHIFSLNFSKAAIEVARGAGLAQ